MLNKIPMKSSSRLLAVLSVASFIPSVQADCTIDENGFEHCSLSNGARIGIAIALIILALLFIASAFTYRRRRMRNGGGMFISQGPVNNQNVAYGPGGYPSGYNTQSGYYPNGPQYPPQTYAGGYAPENTYGPPMNPPPPAYYAPPSGPPPDMTKN